MNKAIVFTMFFCFAAVQCQGIDKYSLSLKGTVDWFANRFEEGVELNAFSNTYVYTIGYYFGEDYELWVSPSEKYKQFNLLFGKYIDSENQKFRIQYQAGIGVFWGIFRTNKHDRENSGFILNNAYFTEKINKSLAIPLKIGGRYLPFKFLSIGIDIQANINKDKTIMRPMLSIAFGKLRNK